MKTLMRNDFLSASDHGNPAEITVSMPKETTSKGMGVNINVRKWLSYSRGISEILDSTT